MIRYLLICLITLSFLTVARGQSSLKEARKRLLKGNYAEARAIYEKLAKKAEDHNVAAVGISRSWRSVGEYDKALQALDTALKDSPKSADLLAEKADLLFFRGRWQEAETAAKAASKGNDEQFLAHWVLARLHRDRGELKQADEQLVWFIRAYAKRENAERPITDPDQLLLVGLAAVERARKDPRLSDQFQFVLTQVWKYAVKLDKDFWWGEYYRGKLFQEKYSYGYATRAFDKALAMNPQAAEVMACKGLDALRRYQMKDAELFADQALEVNPRLPTALRLKADIFLTAGDTAKAMLWLEKASKVNPRDEETLARVAACYHLDHQKKKLAGVIEKVEKQDPKAGLFYTELGERLDERKHYKSAEVHFKKALELRPKLVDAQNKLGLLYMRLGREKEAKKILDAAFEADSFNVRVYNTLKVLHHLKDYETLKTPHFHIRFDPQNDKLLAHFVAQYLEDIYDELAKKFQHHPKGPILIEIFNKHQMFSGRVVALPDLHTIGACTGKMIAMVSPHDKSKIITKPFSWNRVLRHEMVHIFNLEQTNFLVPHWFTEGLAVRAENMPMPPLWHTLLRERVDSGKLMNLDNIHLGFIRPGSSDEWHLAYLQSKLYVDYLVKTYGQKAVAGFLDAYRDGLDTAAALQKVCKVSKGDFEKGYRHYLEEMAKKMTGRLPEKRLTFKQLRDKHAKDPSNPDITAALAEQYLFLGNRQKARELADKALAKKENHPVASYVKARLLLAAGDNDSARKLLKAALTAKEPNLKVVKVLGSLEFNEKNFTEAAEIYELGRKAQPYESYWLKNLVRCYRQNGDTARLIESLKQLVPTDADDLANRVQLAQLLAKAGQHAEAERYAREALEIDVYDPDAQQILEDSLREQNKNDELKKLQELLKNR